MEDWIIWATVAGSIIFVFIFCFIVVVCYRRQRRESVRNLLATRYSRHSALSVSSFTAAPWRTSVHLGNRASQVNPLPGGVQVQNNPNPMGKQHDGSKLNNPNNRITRHSMALEIIQEYEEKEAELGLGVNYQSTCIAK